MVKKTIELSSEQLKKVEILESNGVDVGEAIDILFKIKEDLLVQSDDYFDERINVANNKKSELEEKLHKINQEIRIFNKLKDSSLDFAQKQEILEKEYANIDKTYDVVIQEYKHKFSWMKNIFKV
ncbi:hypothetical protein [Methanobrevibacter olleyae]|uniref:Uncharacterized protein n=1 Tax=Methanobrevibacter olleyae TaxID=294671 RepID=A0A126QZF8_METOL|nr:hypothetical protein [Methanobrevibacter olleyae]AMK15218.1 hypothetical protein YLM1_0661 [Methanobrevibacter olleyae]SFL71514.1 hypothetical protein SAMN02910297_01586 [Methanobrevibacter olleyae]